MFPQTDGNSVYMHFIIAYLLREFEHTKDIRFAPALKMLASVMKERVRHTSHDVEMTA
jgi:hypothetical protein